MAASFAMQMYAAKGDTAGSRAAAKRALARIEKVIAAEPDHGRALGYGAGVLAILGEADRTKEWIERGALLDPNNTILHFNFTCALARLRRASMRRSICWPIHRQGFAGHAVLVRQRHRSRSAA